jgi:hypothetical protein
MSVITNIILIILIVIFAILTGYVIYKFIIEKYILSALCLINTNKCIKIEYYSIDNSALINIPSTGYWIWYNDGKVYTYGGVVDQNICDVNYSQAYVTDITTKSPQLLGYQCIRKFDEVQDFYISKSKKKFIYYKNKDPLKIPDMFDILNEFEKKGILNLNYSK